MGMTIGRALCCYATLGVALTCSILMLAKPNDKNKEKENDSEVKFTARAVIRVIYVTCLSRSLLRCGNGRRGIILKTVKEDANTYATSLERFALRENGTRGSRVGW